MTEIAESQKLTYLKELGEDGEYKYVAKIDSETSKLCHSLNGKIFKVKGMIPGVNAHLYILGVEVPQCQMSVIGETSSLKSVKVNIG
ncbi:TPA: minor capsid protein [Staphylococcus aureus]|nr:minor capsid protein [Staphylococcus aureus]HDF5270964.1 minor capsid protein [Staphylococcus aureus]HDG4188474.1 minor capsid protein [Staphylococcus aureus]